MHPTLKLTKLVLRPDGKYDCEVAVKSLMLFGRDVPLTKGQKIVLKVGEEDLGEDLCSLMTNIRSYIEKNANEVYGTWIGIENGSLQVEQTDTRTARWKGAGMGDYTCTWYDNTISGRPPICPTCHCVMDNPEEPEDEDIIDEVGGCHGGGIGFNPQGVWCGECTNVTCAGCVNQHVTKEEDEAERRRFTENRGTPEVDIDVSPEGLQAANSSKCGTESGD